MIADVVREHILKEQGLVGRNLTFSEVVDLFEESSEELRRSLQQMNNDGYLYFDGDIIMVY